MKIDNRHCLQSIYFLKLCVNCEFRIALSSINLSSKYSWLHNNYFTLLHLLIAFKLCFKLQNFAEFESDAWVILVRVRQWSQHSRAVNRCYEL